MSVILTGDALIGYNILLRTELSGDLSKVYKLEHAVIGNSGYSFGVPQFDLGQDSDTYSVYGSASKLLRHILVNAKDSEGHYIVEPGVVVDRESNSDIQRIVDAVVESSASINIEMINRALSSPEGVSAIDVATESYINHLAEEINQLMPTYLDGNRDLIFGLLFDYRNQFYFTPGGDGQSYLKGFLVKNSLGRVQEVGAFGVSDWLRFRLTQTWSIANVPDINRRITEVLSVVNYVPTLEDALEIVQVWYDYNLIGRGVSLDGITNAARSFLLDTFSVKGTITYADIIVGSDVAANNHWSNKDYIAEQGSTFSKASSNQNELIIAQSGDDTVYALGGDDVVYGGADSDTLYGGEGDDYLHGDIIDAVDDCAADTLIGNAGSDTLVGGRGADTLMGGADSDTYIFNTRSVNLTHPNGDGIDRIIDWEGGNLLKVNGETLGTFVLDGSEGITEYYLRKKSDGTVDIDGIQIIKVFNSLTEDYQLFIIFNDGDNSRVVIDRWSEGNNFGIVLTKDLPGGGAGASMGDRGTIPGDVNDGYRDALNFVPFYDPLILDLNGNGIETLPADGGVLFDLNVDGVKEGTGWVAPSDGMLVIDKNGNGAIDDGRELFGDRYIKQNGIVARDGFDAVSDVDSNGDGKIDSADALWQQLKIWKDADSDGIADSGELISLDSINGIGIKEISLANTPGTVDVGGGNIATANGTFVWNNNTTGVVSEVAQLNFASNPFYREFTPIAIPADKQSLPDMAGSGSVRDLREAATQSAELEATLRLYKQATTRDQQLALLDKLIADWAGSSTQLDWVERLEAMAVSHNGSPGTMPVNFRVTASAAAHANDNADLDTSLTDPANYIAFSPLSGSDKVYTGDALRVGRFAESAKLEALAKLRVLEIFNGQNFFSFGIADADTNGDSVADRISATITAGISGRVYNALIGAATQGPLVVTDDDFLLANQHIAAIDQSYKELRVAIYNALLLQTRLKPYVDSIDLTPNTSGTVRMDFTQLNAGLEALKQADPLTAYADLVDLVRVGAPLFAWGWTGDKLLRSWVEQAAGYAPLQALLSDMDVLYGNGNLSSSNDSSMLLGQDGINTLVGANGDDFLSGSAGNDTLYAGNGSDLLVGGIGNDLLSGGSGNDVYLVGRGQGQDIVEEFDGSAQRMDVIQFADGIMPEDVVLSRQTYNLVITFKGSTDKITVTNHFMNDPAFAFAGHYGVQALRFADGTVWNQDAIFASTLIGRDVASQSLQGGSSADSIIGRGGADDIDGGAGNDTLDGGDHNDILDGDAGNDILLGGSGDDTLRGGVGNDVLDGGAGNDTLNGGEGNDIYLFGTGSGNDVISFNGSSSYNEPGKIDAVQLGSDITTADVVLSREGSSGLRLSLRNGLDSLVLDSYFFDGPNSLKTEEIRFADGTVWLESDVRAMIMTGNDFAQYMTGFSTADTINGAGGSDTLFGLDGDDVLDGGAGDDILEGGLGNDTYMYSAGSGTDRILLQDGDVLQLSGSLIISDLIVSRDPVNTNDLVLTFKNSSDKIILSGYLFEGAYSTGTVLFPNGTVLSAPAIRNAALATSSQNDFVMAYADNETLNGAAGADTLFAGSGNDVLIGGAGNDTLMGEMGADTYMFELGFGQDIIQNYYNDSSTIDVDPDVIHFGTGINAANITAWRQYDDLYLRVNGTSDLVTVRYYFENNATARSVVETIRFGDGTEWDVGDVTAALLPSAPQGSIVQGSFDNDSLVGGVGNDTLEAYDGDDLLNGGQGNDTLIGGNGADTYLFGNGSGQDTIINNDSYDDDPNPDVVQLGSGIGVADVIVRNKSNGLVLILNGGSDQLTVSGYSNNPDTAATIDAIRFADGTTWDIEAIAAKALLGTEQSETLVGWATSDSISAGAGDDHVFGSSGGDWLYGGHGNDTLLGENGDDVLFGEAGSDSLNGGSGADSLYGGDGSDWFEGDIGNDILDGGAGNDYLIGGRGADTYLFGRGYGHDTVSNFDTDSLGSNPDVILLGAGLTAADITVSNDQGNLVLRINDTGEELLAEGAFASPEGGSSEIDRIQFADGSFWDRSTLRAMSLAGSDKNQLLIGSSGADVINAGAGADTVWAGGGSDTIDGGSGNDFLMGQDGSDTYVFGRGDGQDIVNNDHYSADSDRIVFKSGVSASDIVLRRVPSSVYYTDVEISIVNSSDTLTLQGYLSGDTVPSRYSFSSFEFADGTVWTQADFLARLFTGSSLDDFLVGTINADSISGNAGDDGLQGRAGNDTLNGNGGYDTLLGESGNDTLDGGSEADWLAGGIGADTLRGGLGQDSYLFAQGDGNDIVDNYDSGGIGNVDRIEFQSSVSEGSVSLSKQGQDLLISYSGGSIRVLSHFSLTNATNVPYAIDEIRFSNGNVWDMDDILTAVGGAANVAPVAVNDSVATNEDAPLVLNVADLLANDTDANLDALAISSVFNASHGTVSFNASTGVITFTPHANYSGPASFSYSVTDGQASVTGNVAVSVNAVNDAPLGTADSIATSVGTPLVITAASLLSNDIDVEGNTLTITGVSNAQHGTVSLNTTTGEITFIPEANYSGPASFDYTVSDGSASTVVSVGVAVNGSNHAPVGGADSAVTQEDTPIVIAVADLLANDTDADGNTLTLTGVSNAQHGTVSLNTTTGEITFTPDANYNGPASFDYTVSDGTVSSSASVAVTVNAVNDNPVATADSAVTQEDTPLVIAVADLLANDTDADGNPLSITGVSNAQHGTVSLNTTTGEITFTPDANYNGPASFDYTVSDGTVSSSASVAVTVNAVNDSPVATADSAVTQEDTPLVIAVADLLANDMDADGNTLTITGVSNAQHGTVSLNTSTGEITFTPDANYNGPASFDYTVSDGTASSTASVAVTVNAVNDAPTAVADSASTQQDSPLQINAATLLANDSDIDGGTLSVTGVGSASNGTVQFDANTNLITFTPTTGFTGNATFTYTVSDGVTASTATVTVQVAAGEGQYIGGTNGADVLYGSDGIDIIYGEAGNDTIYAGAGNDTLFGGIGNDDLIGQTDVDTMIGGEGDDQYRVDNIGDVIIEYANEGSDQVGSFVDYTLGANLENLFLLGTANLNATANDLNNVVWGNDGDNTVSGLGGNDEIYGGGGNDALLGGNGNDHLNGGTGADTLSGGAGDDDFRVDDSGDVVIENAGEGYDQVGSAINYSLGANIEGLYLLGTANLNAVGNALNNVIYGNDGHNTLQGEAGNDELHGGEGNDTLNGGDGADLMLGNAGDDVYLVDNSGDAVSESSGNGTDRVISSIAYTLGDNVEQLELAGSANLDGTGNALNNRLDGNAGNNTLSGLAGNDELYGLDGSDRLIGGVGNDDLRGGLGSDTYVFGRGDGVDQITDHDAAANTDVLQFGTDIANDQLWFSRIGDALKIEVIGTGEGVTINDWYLGIADHVEQIKVASGLTLLDSQVDNLVDAMASFSPPASGQTTLPNDYQSALGSVIAANWS